MQNKKHLVGRSIGVVVAVIIMGFALSWLVLVDMGTDPATAFNLAVSEKIGMSIGNWQAIWNCVMFIPVILFGRKNIGLGTIANMFLVGYSLQFFSWLWSVLLPAGLFDSMWVRLIVLFPALFVFIVSAAVYMDVQMGTSPYDSLAFMLAQKFSKFPLRAVRITYDMLFVVMALLVSRKFGLVTLLMALLLGPAIEWVGKKLSRFLE